VLTTIHLNIWLGILLPVYHGEVRRAHQMLNAALEMTKFLSSVGRKVQLNQRELWSSSCLTALPSHVISGVMLQVPELNALLL